MKKFVCTVCGYVHEGDSAPEKCPQCGVGADKFTLRTAQRLVNSIWLRELRLRTWMRSTIPCMRWQGMRPDMEKRLRVC